MNGKKTNFIDTVSKKEVYNALAQNTELSLEDLTTINNVVMSMHHGSTMNDNWMVTWHRMSSGEVYLIIDELHKNEVVKLANTM